MCESYNLSKNTDVLELYASTFEDGTVIFVIYS